MDHRDHTVLVSAYIEDRIQRQVIRCAERERLSVRVVRRCMRSHICVSARKCGRWNVATHARESRSAKRRRQGGEVGCRLPEMTLRSLRYRITLLANSTRYFPNGLVHETRVDAPGFQRFDETLGRIEQVSEEKCAQRCLRTMS